MTATLAQWLVTATWKGTLLIAILLLLHRFFRNRVPARWWCALVLVAIVRTLIPIAPAARFSVFNLVTSARAGAPVLVVANDATPPPPAGMKRAFLRSPAPPAPAPWVAGLLVAWAVGVSFLLGRTAWQLYRFRRQLAGSIDVVRDDVLLLVEACRTRLGVRRRVRILSTGAVATPSLYGWLRPSLLLPQGFLESFTREQLRYVILHELAHLRRSDVPLNWLATLARVLHWFNPLVHLAVLRLAEERELACDALALAALEAEERPAYGGTVLEIVERLRTGPMVPAAAGLTLGMSATPQQLKRRIVMIASFRRPSRHSLAFAALVLGIGLVTLTDARAGDVVYMRHAAEPLSPATKIVVDSLEQTMNVELTAASLDEVLHAVSNATGTTIKIADGAVDDAQRQSHVTLKGTNVPAHLVLMETLSAFELAVKFSDAGVEVIKPRDDDHGPMRMRIAGPAPEEGALPRKVMIVQEGGEGEDLPGGPIIERKLDIKTDGQSPDGGRKHKVTFRSSKDGQETEGTFEIEVTP